MITQVANTKGLDNHELKKKVLESKIAKETYKCQHKVFINTSMKHELSMTINILSKPNKIDFIYF